MKKKIIISIAILALTVVIIAVVYTWTGKKAEVIHTTGIIEGIEVNLSPKISGRISEICCNEGDKIKSGQIAIRLESEDLEASVDQAKAGVDKANTDIKVCESAIESSKANIKSAEADIKTAESAVEKAKVQMELAKIEMDRSEELYKKNYVSKESLDLALTTHNAALADYASSKSQLTSVSARRDSAVAQLSTAESQLKSAMADLKQAEANLAYNKAKLADTVIKSPISGAVVFKSLEKGETVSPGVTILTIVDLADLYVRVDLDETMVDNIALDSEAIIRTVGTPPRTFKGKVYEIGRYAEFATQTDVTRGRQDIKTFRVKVRFDDTGGVLKPGMTVKVEIPKKL
jgi:multidrug resistance efflux pump